MKGKKWIAILLAVVILLGAGGGGLLIWKNNSGEVNVYPVDYFTTSADWATSSQTDGIVSTDRIQSVYISSTQVVTAIHVEEGQSVKEGDLLLSFDTTLSELNLHRQAIKVDQLELDIENAEKELKEISTYRVGSSGGSISSTPEPTSTPLTSVTEMPFNRTPEALGTKSDPLIYLWNDASSFNADFIREAVSLAMTNRNTLLNGGKPTETTVPVDPTAPTPTPTPSPTPSASPTPSPTPTATATASPTPPTEPVETDDSDPTPVPADSATPEPTDTPDATDTPEPTDTPENTDDAGDTGDTGDSGDSGDTGDAGDTGNTDSSMTPTADGVLLPVQPGSGVRLHSARIRHLSPANDETAPTPDDPDDPDDTDKPDETEDPEPTANPIDDATLAEIADPEVYVVFEVREADALNGSIQRVWEMAILVDATTGVWSFRMVDPSYDPGDEDDSSQSGLDSGFTFDSTIYYTASEIAQMKAQATQKIKDLELELKTAQLEYEQLEYELSNGEVYAKIDGVVKTVRDPDEAQKSNMPAILVSGGGGYYVTAVLGEFELNTMHIGDTVNVQSWENGNVAEGTITEISEYPDETGNYWYYSEGNQNISKYPFKVFVNEDANLREGESVTLTYSSSGAGTEDGLFLNLPFVREENGKNYIYVRGEDGLLEKRLVTTGRNLWGSYLEILDDGLSEDDYIAFPYGRNLRDGAKTREADTDELYSSYY